MKPNDRGRRMPAPGSTGSLGTALEARALIRSIAIEVMAARLYDRAGEDALLEAMPVLFGDAAAIADRLMIKGARFA